MSDMEQTGSENPEVVSQVGGVASEPMPEAAPTSDLSDASSASSTSGGPLNLEQIRKLREAQAAAAPAPKPGRSPKGPPPSADSKRKGKGGSSEGDKAGEDDGPRKPFSKRSEEPSFAPKVAVPNVRAGLSDDLAMELDSAIADVDFDKLLVGDKSLQVGKQLEEGQRYSGRVIKIHHENVFISLGGPDEGIVPLLQFNDAPKEGDTVDCIIRSFNREEGLYEISIPGEAVNVNDWGDLEEGVIVEARIESANTGGVECKVGNVRGFIPISQLAEYRVETPADFIGQKLLCVITEANERRGNLVLSHRAVLEREKESKKKERFEKLEIGQSCEGVVRKIMDFGAFVDIGGLDGLIHISQLSWDRIKHPSEVVKEGDKIQVRIEKIDVETGKIGLSYRSIQDHPWNDIDARFPIGSVVHGTVSRIANFGAFVKLAIGIEGLVHLSELANRRVSSVGNIVQEGQEVDVKILSVDRDAQRISLSIKQTQAAPEESKVEEPAVEEAPRKPVVPKHRGPLKGGTEGARGGEKFGLKW